MSVLIKGMEMPTSCDDCRFSVDGWCYACIPESDAERRRITTNYCPLVPVPPHGDLKDADALMCEWEVATNANGERFPAVSAEKIQAAPTIIPADGASARKADRTSEGDDGT